MSDDLRQDILKESDARMGKSIEALQAVFGRIRTGRANVNLLDGIQVSYYGVDTPLNQVASVSVEDARTLVIVPWERKILPDIEKAILKSDLGLNPSSTSEKVRIPLPSLTEENRKDLIKQARGEAENARVAVRNIRRDAMADIKSLADARGHIARLKAQGAISIKNYNQPRRDQRQMVVTAAREAGLNVVAEGGSL